MRGPPRFPLSQLLQRDANNLDLVRLVCSALVIFGHSFAVVANQSARLPDWDVFMWLRYPGVYSASTAVKIFFFISGLLVTHSLLTKKSPRRFIFGRVFRIWPALVAVLVGSAFVIGPIFTVLGSIDYLTLPGPYRYVLGGILMFMPDDLPGVFTSSHIPGEINGALWTLPYEVGAYIAVLLLWLGGVLRHRWLGALLVAALAIDPLREQPWVMPWIHANPQIIWLPFCFAFGAFLAVMADRVTLGPLLPVGLLVAFALLPHSSAALLVGLVAMFLALLYASGLSWVRRLRLKTDFSYGAFIWGFPVQQMLAAQFPQWAAPRHFIVSFGCALVLAYGSWHLIEKPAIRLGRRWADRAPVETGRSAAIASPS